MRLRQAGAGPTAAAGEVQAVEARAARRQRGEPSVRHMQPLHLPWGAGVCFDRPIWALGAPYRSDMCRDEKPWAVLKKTFRHMRHTASDRSAGLQPPSAASSGVPSRYSMTYRVRSQSSPPQKPTRRIP